MKTIHLIGIPAERPDAAAFASWLAARGHTTAVASSAHVDGVDIASSIDASTTYWHLSQQFGESGGGALVSIGSGVAK